MAIVEGAGGGVASDKLTYDLEAVATAIETIRTNVTELDAQQASIIIELGILKEAFQTTGSETVYTKLEEFLSETSNSTLSTFIADATENLTKIEAVLTNLQDLDQQGSM